MGVGDARARTAEVAVAPQARMAEMTKHCRQFEIVWPRRAGVLALGAVIALTALAAAALGAPTTTSNPKATTAQPTGAKPAATADERMDRLARSLASGGSAKTADPTPTKGKAASPSEPPAAAPEQPTPALTAAARENLPLGRASTANNTVSSSAAKPGASWILTTLASLGVVIGLILLLRAALVRLAGRNFAVQGNPLAEVLGRVALAPKRHLVFIRAGRRVLIVGDSPQGLATIADLDDPEEVAAILQAASSGKSGSITRGFNQLLSKFHNQYEPKVPDEGADTGEQRVGSARDEVSGLVARLRLMAGEGKRT